MPYRNINMHIEIKKEEGVRSCFVMMPFGAKGEYPRGKKESDYVYKHIIKPAIEQYQEISAQKLDVYREVDKSGAGSITKSILRNIANADICIVDITGLNANVFFELGIRYAFRRRITILLRQKETIIPFDISGYKCLVYDCFEPDTAQTAIVEFLKSGFEEKIVDSLVFETFPDMNVYIPDILREVRDSISSRNTMDWDEWWFRVQEISRTLDDSFKNGRFVPSAILGISNGGLLLADILGRSVYHDKPILCLWAHRSTSFDPNEDHPCYFFDNEFNKAMLSSLKNHIHPHKITILLVDDVVVTGATVQQAFNYIKKELGNDCDIVFTPLYCNNKEVLEKIKDMLPASSSNHKRFLIAEEEYYKRLATAKSILPYEKALYGER